MTAAPRRILVFGGSGQTGQHFVRLALASGDAVRVLARDPHKMRQADARLDVVAGSVTDPLDLDELVQGVDAVVVMLGDVQLQRDRMIVEPFMRELVPSLRRHGVRDLVYQAGAFSRPPDRNLPLALRALRATLGAGYRGQHEDNEAVMRYLVTDAQDIDWVVHRAAISGDGDSKGTLHQSRDKVSRAPFIDTASYNYSLMGSVPARHTCDLSAYVS